MNNLNLILSCNTLAANHNVIVALLQGRKKNIFHVEDGKQWGQTAEI